MSIWLDCPPARRMSWGIFRLLGSGLRIFRICRLPYLTRLRTQSSSNKCRQRVNLLVGLIGAEGFALLSDNLYAERS